MILCEKTFILEFLVFLKKKLKLNEKKEHSEKEDNLGQIRGLEISNPLIF
jgi:hypothetical protein